MLNVEHGSQLLTGNHRLVIQLHLSSELGPIEASQPIFLENPGYRQCLGLFDVWGSIEKNQWFSRAISELKWTTGCIFYSFEVLISTIELQSMSLIGPLVMKIDDLENYTTHISAKSASLLGTPWSSLVCDDLAEM